MKFVHVFYACMHSDFRVNQTVSGNVYLLNMFSIRLVLFRLLLQYFSFITILPISTHHFSLKKIYRKISKKIR